MKGALILDVASCCGEIRPPADPGEGFLASVRKCDVELTADGKVDGHRAADKSGSKDKSIHDMPPVVK
jgi:hypothetical protein